MPRPVPDYVPTEVRQRLDDMDMDLKTLAISMGCSRTKLYGYFSSSHSQILPYRVLAYALGITLDRLRTILIDGSFADLFDLKCNEHGCENPTQLARKLRLSASFIVKLRNKKINGEALNNAAQVADALGMTLDALIDAQEKLV